ncbi:MAG: DUF6159 family protein [Gammaproteobacteria bacterium]|jgi:hypothetical protein|nr:DUF6159 family protein [Gammaproteobacteria bacterium]
MAGRFARSLELAKASWTVVRADKELLLLPVMSVASLIVILGSLAVPVAVLGGFTTGAASDDPGAGTMLGALLFYIVVYFITLFFNTALVGAAMLRMDGQDPRLGDGLRIAWERVGRIFLYACIAATVGVLLRAIEERVGWLGRIVVKLIGVGWALATFLVVPVLVARNVGPIEAVKDSAGLLRRTWGENIIGNVGLGLVFGLAYFGLAIVAVFVVMAAIQSGSAALIALVVALGLLAFFTLSALHATMQGVYSAALYRYATDHATPLPGFGPELLEQAFAPKK